jgi:cysteine desulfurase
VHLVTSRVEHPSVDRLMAHLESRGARVTRLAVDRDGNLNLQRLEEVLKEKVTLVSLMAANNETGVVFPIAKISELCRQAKVPFHCDAVQLVGKLTLGLERLGVDLFSCSAHKIGGLKGTGALYVRPGTAWEPMLWGGEQEEGRRAGTENVPGIVCFGVAAKHAVRETGVKGIQQLRDGLEEQILKIPGTFLNGASSVRLPNTSSVGFEGVEAEVLMLALDRRGICVSTGSACSTGSLEPSHVLRAMGLTADRARSVLRFSLGPTNTKGDVEKVMEVLPGLVEEFRGAGV